MTRSQLMTKAHRMTRRTVARYPDADYAVTLGAALRILHAERRMVAELVAWNERAIQASRDAMAGLEVWGEIETIAHACEPLQGTLTGEADRLLSKVGSNVMQAVGFYRSTRRVA